MKVFCLIQICLLMSVISTAQNKQNEVVIDETHIGELVVDSIEIDRVWSGHPVGFSLLTSGNRQYIAYYNENRNMVVGQRNLEENRFSLHVMPATARETHKGTSTVLGWDSHNSVTMGIDVDGYIHLAGNMHVHPLTYFRSAKPHDISTLIQHFSMTGSNEDRCTYPDFMKSREGKLIFHYRDGSSGNGNEIYNIYNIETKTWERLLDAPLTDGKGQMNAYQSEPELMKDDWYHVYWVWRDTPDCATNHDLSYMKSPDLVNWFDAFGNPVDLPATIDNQALIVDPIPPGGGIINLAAKLCLDQKQRPVFIYHKYDHEGNLQFYIAQIEGTKWKSKQITDWNHRWEFSGNGSIIFDVYLKSFNARDDGNYEVAYWHVKYGDEVILLSNEFGNIGKVIKSDSFSKHLKPEGDFKGLGVRTTSDLGQSDEKDIRYLLKWETLPQNRDEARQKPWPEPSSLILYKLKQVQDQ